MPIDWEDEYSERERVRYTRAPRDLLVADRGDSYARRRSRSTDARQPNFNLSIHQDRIIDEFRSPSRGRHSQEDVVDGIDDIRHELHELRRDREYDRDRHRNSSPLGREDMQLALLRERERFDIEREREKLERDIERLRMGGRDSNQELVRARSDIRRLEDKLAEDDRERRRREERDRVLAERDREEREEKEKRRLYKLEIERKEQQEKEERKMMLTEMQLEEERKKKAERAMLNELQLKEEEKKRAEKEKEAAAVAAYEKKKAEEKKKKEELLAELRREEEEKKRKEKEEEERWRLKLERKKQEEEEKEKAKKKEIEDEIRRKLHRVGYQDNQIDVIIDEKKQVPKTIAYAPASPHRHKSHSNALVAVSSRSETFVKIHRDHLDIETLRYFKLPYTVDEVDSDYFIIYQELDQRETDLLFEHTRKLRKRHREKELVIEDRGRKHEPQLAFVRRRSVSASPNRKRDKSADKREKVIRLW